MGKHIKWFLSRPFRIGLMRCLTAGILLYGIEPAQAGWQLAWSDDFSGNTINTNNWTFDNGNGNGGWGNRELEYYTSRAENAYVSDGMLHIVARKETYEGQHYTSAKLKTRGLFSQKYGRFEFYARLPQGKGYWPALWMMPEHAVYGGWAASGEIDVMENKGADSEKIFGTIHFGGASPHNAHSHNPGFDFPSGDSAANFHLYAVEWTTNAISWYVDSHLYERQTNWWSSSNPENPGDHNPYPAPFNQPFYIIMNLAVGGNFGGDPDDTTVFPGEMQIKYVRVYGRTDDTIVPANTASKADQNSADHGATASVRADSAAPALQPSNNSGPDRSLQFP
jgi:beta-glucanase (GH16 family)